MENDDEEEQFNKIFIRHQSCPVCLSPIGDMPGSHDAFCHTCGFKDPCCE